MPKRQYMVRFYIFAAALSISFSALGKPIFFENGGKKVQLEWDGPKEAEYIVEISQDPFFAKAFSDWFTTDTNNFTINIKNPGKLYWRVEGDNYIVPEQTLDVLPAKDRLPAPKVAKSVVWASQDDFPEGITWPRVKGAGKYVLDVYDWQEQKYLLRLKVKNGFKKAKTFHQIFKKAGKGYYFYRIAAVDKKGFVGEKSDWKLTYAGDLGPEGEKVGNTLSPSDIRSPAGQKVVQYEVVD